METKFYKLFPNGICFDTAGHGTLMQDRYNELDDEKIKYIENATYMHHEMYKMLESLVEKIEEVIVCEGHYFNDEDKKIKSLLEKARGEHE